jgi:hypothetical protein
MNTKQPFGYNNHLLHEGTLSINFENMKKIGLLFILVTFILLKCSKEDSPLILSSAGDFYKYCSTNNNNSCGELLNHENQYITMIGYVNAIYINPYYNSFQLFDSMTLESNFLTIEVIVGDTAIFDKLLRNVDTINIENFKKIKVTGKIIGSNIEYVNKGCRRNPSLVVDNSNDVSFI